MKFLITGGAGFIGSHIAEKLVERGDIVTVIDNLNTGKEKNLESIKEKINFIKGSILDVKLLEEITGDIDGVFHQAALASVQESFSKADEYREVNVKGTENILKLAKKYGFRIVQASSSSIYGNPISLPMKEDAPKNPINPYAQTKVDQEKVSIEYAKTGVEVICLRYFNVFGKRQSKEYAGVIKLFLERIQQKEPPKINGDGLQTRDFVYVEDVVNANLMSMESDVKHEFFNVGTGSNNNILDIANFVINASGLPLKPIHGPELPGDVRGTKADIILIQNKLGWKPKTFLEDWLTKTVRNMNLSAKHFGN